MVCCFWGPTANWGSAARMGETAGSQPSENVQVGKPGSVLGITSLWKAAGLSPKKHLRIEQINKICMFLSTGPTKNMEKNNLKTLLTTLLAKWSCELKNLFKHVKTIYIPMIRLGCQIECCSNATAFVQLCGSICICSASGCMVLLEYHTQAPPQDGGEKIARTKSSNSGTVLKRVSWQFMFDMLRKVNRK